MQEKDNYLKNAELSTEQNYNMIDGILNNEPTPVPEPGREPLDKVKEPPRKKRRRERDDRLPESASVTSRSTFGCDRTSWRPYRNVWPPSVFRT